MNSSFCKIDQGCSKEEQRKESLESVEDNSLSISLPSEGSQRHHQNQLSEVKAGILKIFMDAETHVQSTFDEKHEFEKTEKMVKGKTSSSLAWSSTDIDQPDEVTTTYDDSGIEGAQSRCSTGSKVWGKINRQLNRRFGGSTGSLSSTSPISEKKANALESPTEGIHML